MAEVDWEQVRSHMRAVVAGDGAAWSRLQTALYEELLRLARFQPLGRLRDDIDTAAEIAMRVLGRLHAHDFRALRRLFATETPIEPRAWIRVLVRTTAIDFMRQHTEYVRGSDARAAGWVSLRSLVSQPGGPVPDSLVHKRRDLERFLTTALEEAQRAAADHGDDAASVLAIAWKIEPRQARRLLKKGAHYLPVLRLVLAGHSYAEVGAEVGISRREVELTLSYVEEFLKARRFAA